MKLNTSSDLANLLQSPHIQRSLHSDLVSHIPSASEITILYGPRQVGKSQEIFACIKELLDNGTPDIFFYNLDITPPEFSSPDNFVATLLAQKSSPDRKTFVFLDEAQHLPNIGLFVKYIYDQNKHIKFVLTGSASLEIKAKIKEPLTGRKKEFFLPPLTLREILEFKGVNLAQITQNFPALQQILQNYLLFGGYPQVILFESDQLKADKLKEIAQSYVLKDVSAFFNLSDSNTLRLVSSFLAESVGNILSKENISKLAQIPKYQTEKALLALEKSFIVKLVSPFSKTPSKELIHRPKVFFQDTGIRNAILGKLDSNLILTDKGSLFENVMATELASIYGQDSLRYWRTINQTEVDFIISRPNGQIFAFEAKYSWQEKNSMPKNLKSFSKLYKNTIVSPQILSASNYWKLYK